MDVVARLVVAKGEGVGGGMQWEVEVSRWCETGKLFSRYPLFLCDISDVGSCRYGNGYTAVYAVYGGAMC